jgi:hypothetical protein
LIPDDEAAGEYLGLNTEVKERSQAVDEPNAQRSHSLPSQSGPA